MRKLEHAAAAAMIAARLSAAFAFIGAAAATFCILSKNPPPFVLFISIGAIVSFPIIYIISTILLVLIDIAESLRRVPTASFTAPSAPAVDSRRSPCSD
jgi:hypothetical protein